MGILDRENREFLSPEGGNGGDGGKPNDYPMTVSDFRTGVHDAVELEFDPERPLSSFLLSNSELYKNAVLSEVVSFFNDLIGDLKLSRADFFKSTELMEMLEVKLFEFIDYVEKKCLPEIESRLAGHGAISNFNDRGDWKNAFRKVCFIAFFVHYGAKRKGEYERDQDPDSKNKGKVRVDYVKHVVRASTNNLIRKLMFFDLDSNLIEVLHDVLEDFEYGLLGVLKESVTGWSEDRLDDVDARGFQLKRGNFSEEEKKIIKKAFSEIADSLVSGKLDGHTMLDFVTKSHSYRPRALIEIPRKILNLPESLVFEGLKCLLIKEGDRLENVGTIGETGSRKDIMDESVYFFVGLDKIFEMTNGKDWMIDYLHLRVRDQRSESRTKTLRSDKQIGKLKDAVEQFKRDFAERLRQKLKEKGYNPNISEGHDFVLRARNLGFRCENERDVEKLFKQGRLSQSLRRYIIFYPLSDDAEKNVNLVDAAREVFKDIFSSSVGDELEKFIARDSKEFYDIQLDVMNRAYRTPFGRMIRNNRRVVDPEKNNYDPKKYGVGLWACFPSMEAAISQMLGKYHRAYWGQSGDANSLRGEISIYFIMKIKPRVDSLAEQYDEILAVDNLKNKDLLLRIFELSVMTLFSDGFSEPDFKTLINMKKYELKEIVESLEADLEGYKKFLLGEEYGEVDI